MNIIRKLFLIWVIPMWVLGCLVILPTFLIIFNLLPKDRAWRAAFKAMRLWGWWVLYVVTFSRVKITGADKLDKKKAYILVSNHRSVMDIPLCAVSSPVPFSFLAKAETLKVPVVGYLARNMHVTVDRKDEDSRRKSFVRMMAHIGKGRSISIYPEGTRNRTNKPLRPFYTGAFRLAVDTQIPLAVMTILDSDKIGPPNSFGFMPFQTVHCVWNEPIEMAGKTNRDIPALKKQVAELMLADLGAEGAAWAEGEE